MMTTPGPYGFYLRLLFDGALRERFGTNRVQVLAEAGLSPEDAMPFMMLDLEGLELDARGRQRYLMSALCRPYPLSAGCLGSLPGGAASLDAFLGSDALFLALGPRSIAFGEHLFEVLEARRGELGPESAELVGAVLALERALVQNAHTIREAVARGEMPAAPNPPTKSRLKRGRVVIPPYFLAAQLPVPPQVLIGALDHITAESAWGKLSQGALDINRVRTVARAAATPVTILARGVVKGVSSERAGAGGVAPIVDISHVSAELMGLGAGLLRSLEGGVLFEDLPVGLRPIVTELVKAGVLAV